jgi:hypothetical protein
MELLGLGAIPGSTINSDQSLNVPEPESLAALAISAVALIRKRR